jgi:hypothetical protein
MSPGEGTSRSAWHLLPAGLFTRKSDSPVVVRYDYKLVLVRKRDKFRLNLWLHDRFRPPKAVAEDDPHSYRFGGGWSGRDFRFPGDHRRRRRKFAPARGPDLSWRLAR